MEDIKEVGEVLVRWGYVVRGWLYLSIGWLTVKWALGIGQITPGSKSAINHLSEGSFGKLLLLFVMVGLIGYAIWGVVRAWREKKLVKRIGYLVSAGAYFLLLWPTITILVSGQKSPDRGWKYLIDNVGTPIGRWVVIVAGLVVLGGAITQAWGARHQNYLGRIGLVSRSAMIGLAGFFLFLAGVKINPNEPAAFDQAIIALGSVKYGNVLMVSLGLGLIVLGIHSFTLVRKVRPLTKNEPLK